MFQKIIKVLGGNPDKREIDRMTEVVQQINGLEPSFEVLSDDALRAKTEEFYDRLDGGETLDDILPEAFAAVREASKRNIGLRHYDVQMIGGMTLHKGKISEMRTGEGKTLVATLPLYLNAITRRGVHLVTVNDYLARRDARWMAPVYQALGLTVGVLQMASRTDNGKMAFLVDLEKTSPHEDQHQLRMVDRKEAYTADITYGMNSEFGFDYLRDNLTMSLEERVQRGHYYAIVDEVDNILIDEARTPLIISGPASDESEWYIRMAAIVRQLRPDDYEINERDKAVSLTEVGEAHIEEMLGMTLRDPDRPEDITQEQARTLGYMEQALRAQHLYKRNKDYLVQGGKVIIVDEFTGRLMPGRRWSEGLHQAVEAKEGVKVEPENVTYATVTLQNYYRMYEKLAGMTGTAATESEEFHKIYKLDVLPIPTNLEYAVAQNNSTLTSVEDKDSQGYKYTYYTHRGDPLKQPTFWKRKDYPDVVYRSLESKLRAITQEIIRFHVMGRPQLVGTTSVESSERLSRRLQAEQLRRLAQVLLIRQAYLDKNNLELLERPVPELVPLNKPISDMDVTELRPLARNLGLSMNPEDAANVDTMIRILELKEEDKPRLLKVMQGGLPHQVLNARKHDEESQIIAQAGAFGAVTIATNMAGRGVDIKLGGELPEGVLTDINRVLGKVIKDPYDLTNEERLEALRKVAPEQYGIYEESVKTFLQYMENMERVRERGGLHVIGSERHEARRIDNQLRGRAARQGDPGSSRFYLSLEDELMRLFGGAQVESLWKRIFNDESLPMEMNILGRIVEQSQERVEGSNFDVRKHLLEYDDVLNSQRKRIYSQRDRVFTKEDLTDDVLEMLRTELQNRIPEALKDEEGPWKLLAYLEEIQPPFQSGEIGYPSFSLRLLLDELHTGLKKGGETPAVLRSTLLTLAQRTLEAEREHILVSVRSTLDKTEDSLEKQREERFDTLDTFLEGIKDQGDEEEGVPAQRPSELLMQVSDLVHVQLKLSPDQLRRLPDGEQDVVESIQAQIVSSLMSTTTTRMIGSLERRLEEELGLRSAQFQNLTWQEVSGKLLDAVEAVFDRRMERLLGEQGQIAADLDGVISKAGSRLMEDRTLIGLLVAMTQGTRVVFNQHTHQKTSRRYMRLNYVFLGAHLLANTSSQTITADVLEHLEEALIALRRVLGAVEWDRFAQNQVTLQQLDGMLRGQVSEALGSEQMQQFSALPLLSFESDARTRIQEILGKYIQNETYRQILLRVISDQWVEYLTRVEALRISIGLEAYAQRDPLVQYKSKASEMFQSLLADIRLGVVGRIFNYNPRRVANLSDNELPEAAAETVVSAAADSIQETAGDADLKKKRRRH